MKPTPHIARIYLLIAAFLIALPTLASLYKGQTGRLLIAAGDLQDATVFGHSVIYIERQGLFGAHGYIINKPLRPEQAETVLQDAVLDKPAYYGGPVGHPSWSAVFGRKENGEAGIYRDSDTEFMSVSRLQSLGAEETGLADMRVMFGYAGWGPLQLNYELSRGWWHVIEYDEALVFDSPAGTMWDQAWRKVIVLQPPEAGPVL